jgi:hypothetical protein
MKVQKLAEVAKNVTISNSWYANIDGFEPTVAWFKTRYNNIGWSIVDLDSDEIDWLSCQGICSFDISTIKRTISDKGITTLCMFDLEKGTYAFVDNDVLNETGDIKFEKKTKFSVFNIEDSYVAATVFEIKL